MIFNRWVLGLFLCLTFLAPQGTNAQEDNQQKARDCFSRGQNAYQRGDYDRAIKEWQAAYELSPKPRIKYNLALVYERLGRLADAVNALEHYVDTAGSDDAAHSDAVARLASLQQRLSLTGILIVGGIEGSQILVDGREWGRTPRPDKIFVKPGTHTIVVRHEGYRDFISSVVVGAGQVAEIEVEMTTNSGQSATPLPVTNEPITSETEPSLLPIDQQDPSAEADTDDSISTILFIVSGGLAASALGTGIFWWGGRNSAISECEEPGYECKNLDSIESQRNVAVGITIGLSVGAIGALVLGVLQLPEEKPDVSSAGFSCFSPNGLTNGCQLRF